MARIFITGSADGLGQLAAKFLVAQGHQVVLHARNASRGQLALDKVPGAENVLIADLSSIEETKKWLLKSMKWATLMLLFITQAFIRFQAS